MGGVLSAGVIAAKDAPRRPQVKPRVRGKRRGSFLRLHPALAQGGVHALTRLCVGAIGFHE
jgi:hypothetical protein